MAKKRGILITFIVLSLFGLVAVLEIKRQEVSAQLNTMTGRLQEMQFNTTTKNQETADQIIQDVLRLIEIPEEIRVRALKSVQRMLEI